MKITEQLPHESTRDYAYRVIHSNIVTAQLKPGTPISENEISAEIGLSRTPVREAFIELARSGLIQVTPQRKSRVALIDYNLIEDASFMRRSMETAIAAYICQNCQTLDFKDLEQNLAMQKKFIEKHNPHKFFELDNSFHETLFQMYHKEKCYRVVQGLSGHFDRVRNLSISIMENAKIYEEHRELVNALREGRSTDAVNLVQTHLTNYRKEKKELLKQFPEYFAPGQEESPGDSTQKI